MAPIDSLIDQLLRHVITGYTEQDRDGYYYPEPASAMLKLNPAEWEALQMYNAGQTIEQIRERQVEIDWERPVEIETEWYADHDNLVELATFLVAYYILDTAQEVLYYFEKPWKWTNEWRAYQTAKGDDNEVTLEAYQRAHEQITEEEGQ